MACSLRLLAFSVRQMRSYSGASRRGAIDVLEKEIGGFPPGAGLDMRMHSRSAFSYKGVRSGLGSVFHHRSLAALKGRRVSHSP